MGGRVALGVRSPNLGGLVVATMAQRGVTRQNDYHDVSRRVVTGRCLAMRVGKPSHSYHPEGFLTGAKSPGGEGERER